jgi:hypothetical protein
MLVLVLPYILLSARVCCWPKVASELGIFSVGFGEISWFWEEKFSTFGFDVRNQE